MHELFSIFPSLAKARYNNNQLLESLGKELLYELTNDSSLFDPQFVKIVIERLLSLDFKDCLEAQTFFSSLQKLAKLKVHEI